jgi:predicted nucleic acid-binding protein
MNDRYVVDANIVIQRLIVEQDSPQVKVLFDQMISGTELIVPEFCRLECTNVLWKQVRFQGMPADVAEGLLVQLIALPLTVTAIQHLMTRSLQIGLRYELAIYDSIYIAMAERLDCELITIDRRQANAARLLGVKLKPIGDFK